MIDTSAGRIRLKTLGALELTGPDAPGLHALVSQPKRAALLAYLAIARPRGAHRRDTLLALLWPDSDQERARHALNQLVYYLRRTLGPDVMLSHGDEALGIDGAKLWCDVVAFEEALADNRLEDALELYRGDFLAGFFVPDAAPELDEWIAVERTRLRAAAAGAAWTLATREERAGNGAGAAHWARRATALAPDDEQGVRQLVSLLGRLGDRTGALRVYDDFARRLHQQFEIKPSPELRFLSEELRRTPVSTPLEPSAAVQPAAQVESIVAASPTSPPIIARRRPVRALWAAAAVVVVALLGALLVRTRGHGEPVPIMAVGAVSDFTHGDTAASASVVMDLLATSLARLPSVQVIATARLYEVQSQLQATHAAASLFDAARAAGARQLIQGTLHPNPTGGVRLDLQRIDIKSGAVQKGYRAEGRDLFAAVDQATAAIALDLGVPAPDQPVADVTTHSLVAYRFYEEGLRAYYQNDRAAAERLFLSALDEDSSFAMAAYWAAQVSQYVGEFLERAARLADHATDRERLLIRAKLAESRLDPVAVALAETLAFRYPADPDAQLMLGRVRWWQGDFLGAVHPLRRVLALDSLGLSGRQAQCRSCDAYLQLGLMYLYSDSLPAAERVAREWVSRQPASPRPWLNLSGILEIDSQDSASLAAWQTTDSLTPTGVPQDAPRARLAIRRGDYAEADHRLHRLIAQREWEDAEWFLTISLRNQGRLREAAALPVTAQTVLRGVVLFERGRLREAAADFEARAQQWDPSVPIIGHPAKNLAFNLTHAATCLAAAGDTARLTELADSINEAGRNSLFGRDAQLAHYVRGLLLTARGQPAAAVEEYRKAVFSWTEGYTRVNYVLAQTLLQLGRPHEAIAALQPAFRGSLEAANLYITRTELHELLAQAFDAAGQRDSAIVHWRAVESAWRNADPQFRTRWEAAQRYLSAQ
jgi:DNA-binding SARP family transcriptional activator/Tfp pilus assembly protein PilF